MFKNLKTCPEYFEGLKIKNSSSGFTIVELLISMGLLSFLLISITSIFTASLEVQLRSEATSGRQEDAQYILTRIFYDVNQATAISAPFTINAQQNSLSLTINGQTWTYSLVNGNLVLTNPAGTFQLNGYLTQVTAFTVKRVGNTTGKASIEIALSVGSRISGSPGSSVISFTTTYTKW